MVWTSMFGVWCVLTVGAGVLVENSLAHPVSAHHPSPPLTPQQRPGNDCPCPNKTHCNFVEVGDRQEVLGWSTATRVWRHYDWDKITTVAVFRAWDSDALEMMCYAHSRQVRVVMAGNFPVANFSKPDVVDAWIKQHLDMAEMYRADGINFDIEQPMLNGSKDNELFVSLVRRTRDAFKQRYPHSQVSLDVGWSADCIDNRCYDAKGLSEVTDFLAIMAYDEQSQIFPPRACVAGPNSALQRAVEGINTYLSRNISSQKLILGLPWYGYVYNCLQTTNNQTSQRVAAQSEGDAFEACPIKPVPFQGAPCSDASGTEYDYGWIMQTLREKSTSGGRWDDESMTPYYEYSETVGTERVRHQVWYDNPASLELKYELVKKMQLRGLAFWGVDFLDYDGSEVGKAEAKVMWDVVDARL